MPTLRLTQSTSSAETFHVEAALESDGKRRIASSEFEFPITPQDREDLRWYLEDYLQYAADPAPKIAARVEARIAAMGLELFKALFQTDDDARDLWASVRDRVDETRIEIVSEVQEAASIPWELLRDPKTDTPLALSAKAFVRAAHQSARQPRLAERSAGPIRVLLVICRPGGDEDVPFRSVASRLIKALGGSARDALHLDVLRPPTFRQLSAVLRRAKAEGNPYHVVHFDGHGAFFEVSELRDEQAAYFLSPPRSGRHGYLVFENPGIESNRQYVDGPALGKLLWETGVPVLVLNACRSAHAVPPSQPESAPARGDVHAEARAFGSLAQELVDAGVAGVVAMRYNVYVVTAAQFVADLYESLANGETLGEAVTLGRKQLEAQPLREIAYEPRPLKDWMVPIVHEAAPIALFPRPEKKAELNIQVSGSAAAPSSETLPREVEKRPDAGFFGRDETLLALDRAFDTQPIVLLHAYAGSGKTSTAAEFARWYHLTGGIDGPVLFTSFEQHKPLAQVLNESIGRVFEGTLERSGIQWLALDDEQRRGVALQVLSQIPVLWIWDNIEPIHGFPEGTPSSWSAEEQEALSDFLRAAKQTKAKFLLTSRRDERAWLGDLPARIEVPAMPMQERVQLARALAEKHGRRLTDVDDWMPLLRFTRGNPMTITVLVGQALRDGLKTSAQIETFVERLRSGEAAFEDEASEGRDRSLGASLAYGFDHAFTDAERRQLALLHFFQGFVDVDVLKFMGEDDAPCLSEIRGVPRDAWIALLDRAAAIGLLTILGGGYYSIHPALPWFFRSLFESHYPSGPADEESVRLNATRAFVEAIGALGNYYFQQFGDGNRDVINALAAEEANLLHVSRLARKHGWCGEVLGAMQGLRSLYDQTGRRAEWAQLVAEILPDFVVATSDGPLPGREDDWSLVTEYRVHLADDSRNWKEAERLQQICVNWDRGRAASALAMVDDTWDASQKNAIRTLGASLHQLGEIRRKLEQPECVGAYEEALKLAQMIADYAGSSACTINLGHAYLSLASLRDLDQAEEWYRRSLELRDERDSQGRARCIGQLGLVAYERFRDAQKAKEPEAELLRHLHAALELHFEALELLPANAIEDLQVINNRIGGIYGSAGDTDRALPHLRAAIRYAEARDNAFGAGQIRYNVATFLARQGRLADAWDYALAALRNYEPFGTGAAESIQKTQQLVHEIEQALQSQPGQ